MDSVKFLEELGDILQCEQSLTPDSSLADLEEWDSIAMMTTVAYFDRNLGKKVTFPQLKKCKTAADLVQLAEGA